MCAAPLGLSDREGQALLFALLSLSTCLPPLPKLSTCFMTVFMKLPNVLTSREQSVLHLTTYQLLSVCVRVCACVHLYIYHGESKNIAVVSPLPLNLIKQVAYDILLLVQRRPLPTSHTNTTTHTNRSR